MIINENELKKKNIITIAAAASIALILLFLVAAYRPDFPYYLSIVVELICGSLLAVSLGLCINEETRLHGILFAALLVFAPLFSIIFGGITNNPVTFDMFLQFYGAGFVLGVIYTVQVLRGGISGKLGTALKILLFVFLLVISGIIIYYIIYPLCIELPNYDLSFIISSAYFLPLLISVIGSFLMWCILIKFFFLHNIGIDGSSVFVVGPPSSGKTYLAIGLWEHFGKYKNLEEHETPALNMQDTEAGEASQRLSTLREDLLKKGTLPHTKIGQLSTYEFILKKLMFIPIRWTVMDYPGEKYAHFHLTAYNKALKIVINRLKYIDSENENGDKGWTENKVWHLAETLDLISIVQNEYAVKDEEYAEFMESIVIVIMYVNFRAAGKIIFLIDGNQFKNEWLEKHEEDKVYESSDSSNSGESTVSLLNKAFGEYERIRAEGIVDESSDSSNSGESTVSLNKAFGEYNSILAELSKVNPRKEKKIAKYKGQEDNLLKEKASRNKIDKVTKKRRELEYNNETSTKIAFVVTKTDILCQKCKSLQKIINKYAPKGAPGTFDLSEIKDNKPATEELEQQLFNMLEDMYPNFRFCIAKPIKQHIPTYFIAGSLDASAHADENPGERMGELHLFGFSSIEQFGR